NFLLGEGSTLAEKLTATLPRAACFVGAGVLAGAARECALKMLELTAGRVQTMSESTLGLRHGPMSALNVDTLLTQFVSGDAKRSRYDNDLLREVRAKETTRAIIAVGAQSDAANYSLTCDAFARIPDFYRAPVDAIVGQLLGLFASISAGMKPDAPSPQGVISRVVPPFTIYR
ncbi:MAG: tagatose-6-phosphate ketose isomerase, partial [Bryocella sp.]